MDPPRALPSREARAQRLQQSVPASADIPAAAPVLAKQRSLRTAPIRDDGLDEEDPVCATSVDCTSDDGTSSQNGTASTLSDSDTTSRVVRGRSVSTEWRAVRLSKKRSAVSRSPNEPSRMDQTRSARPIEAKKKKSTFTIRKEEKELLLEELEMLEARAKLLRVQAGIPERSLSEVKLDNAVLQEAIRGQQISLATAQSVVSGSLHVEHTNPLSTYIHLGTDWDERRHTLLGMKDMKLRNALEYVHARSRFLNPLKPHRSDERFEDTHGNYCFLRYDVIQFEGVNSVKQVYDALLFYLRHMEIMISEQLGHITVRDDYDYIEQSISSYRLLSNHNGTQTESNDVMFSKYFESHELTNGAPCGVVAVDSVDEDELYPHTPSERVRKDVAAAIELTPHMRKRGDGEEGEDLVVVMSRGKFLKLYPPFNAVEEMRDGIVDWGDVMVNAINEVLHPAA